MRMRIWSRRRSDCVCVCVCVCVFVCRRMGRRVSKTAGGGGEVLGRGKKPGRASSTILHRRPIDFAEERNRCRLWPRAVVFAPTFLH